MICNAKPYEGTDAYLFVSYSRKDQGIVYPMIERLAAAGVRLWYDSGIHSGQNWPEVIADHLNRSAACLVFLSENAVNSHNCFNELNFAVETRKPLIPVRYNDAVLTLGMRMMIGSVQWLDIRGIPGEAVIAELLSLDAIRPTHGIPDRSIQIQDYVMENQSAPAETMEPVFFAVGDYREQPETEKEIRESFFEEPLMEEAHVFPAEMDYDEPSELDEEAQEPCDESDEAQTESAHPAAEGDEAAPALMEQGDSDMAGELRDTQNAEVEDIPEPVFAAAAEAPGDVSPKMENPNPLQEMKDQLEKFRTEMMMPETETAPVSAAAPEEPVHTRRRRKARAVDEPRNALPTENEPEEALFEKTVSTPAEDSFDQTISENSEDEFDRTIAESKVTLPTILILTGDGIRKRGKPGTTILGRSKNKADIVIPDPERKVSGTHCSIISMDGDHLIEDLDSTNGTWMNGERLPAGERISLPEFAEIQLSRIPVLVSFGLTADSLWKVPALLALRNEETDEVQYLWRDTLKLDRNNSWQGGALRSNRVSHSHASLGIRGNQFVLKDENSRNGTYLNEERVGSGEEWVLETGDVIRIADFHFIVSIYSFWGGDPE